MNKLSLTLLAAVCAGMLFVSAPQDANAYHPLTRGLGGGFGGYGGCADGLSLYRGRQVPVPPYFALHPPVYYSAPVARPYGYSPFPYPGDVRTPEPVVGVARAAAKVVENPFAAPMRKATEKKAELAEDSVAASAPQSIRNPFVDWSTHDHDIHVAKTIETK